MSAALSDQVYAALKILLRGVEEAARDGAGELALELASEAARERLYTRLLTTLLRALFLLFAEDRGLAARGEGPRGGAGRVGLRGLLEQLARDADEGLDAMARRFDAWPRLFGLFREVFEGRAVGHESPASRAGLLRLYDPSRRFLGVGEVLADGRIGPRRLLRQAAAGGAPEGAARSP